MKGFLAELIEVIFHEFAALLGIEKRSVKNDISNEFVNEIADLYG